MTYRTAADAVLVVHFAFVLLSAGGLAVLRAEACWLHCLRCMAHS